MGDRANVAVVQDGKAVYFYTHWLGNELPELVRAALARRQRWDDPSYLARIIFCTMVKGADQGETGFGIACDPQDNSYPILRVNCDDQTVSIAADDRDSFESCKPKGKSRSFTFGEYADLATATWSTLDSGRKP